MDGWLDWTSSITCI